MAAAFLAGCGAWLDPAFVVFAAAFAGAGLPAVVLLAPAFDAVAFDGVAFEAVVLDAAAFDALVFDAAVLDAAAFLVVAALPEVAALLPAAAFLAVFEEDGPEDRAVVFAGVVAGADPTSLDDAAAFRGVAARLDAAPAADRPAAALPEFEVTALLGDGAAGTLAGGAAGVSGPRPRSSSILATIVPRALVLTSRSRTSSSSSASSWGRSGRISATRRSS